MLVLQTIHAKTEENVSPLTMALFVIVVKLISVEFSANKVSENYYHTKGLKEKENSSNVTFSEKHSDQPNPTI